MNVIGFSSGIVGRLGNVDRMVLAVLEKSGYNHEFVKAYRNQAESILGSLGPNDPIDGMTRRVPHSANPGGDRASEAAGLDQGRRQQ